MLRIIHNILFERHIFQFYLMLEKLQDVILYLNKWRIVWIFKHSIFKIKSHVLSYLEIKYSPHHSLIEAVDLQR